MLGRRPAIAISSLILAGAGLSAATLSPSTTVFALLWFLVGIAAIGIYTVCFVWAMESVAGKWKTIVGIAFSFAWPVSKMTTVGLAYFIPDWKILFCILSGVSLVRIKQFAIIIACSPTIPSRQPLS